MKYLSVTQIREAIQALASHHVFYGTTFLVLKKNDAPVGKTMHISLDGENKQHLKRYFRPHPKSDYFFTPFQKKSNESRWRDPKYPSTSLQAINTQAFSSAVLHDKKEKGQWGWTSNYLNFLVEKLHKSKKLPLFHFAVWFGKDEAWDDKVTRADVVKDFLRNFHVSPEEIEALFDKEIQSVLSDDEVFSQTPAKWDRLIEGFGFPEDIPPDTGATLKYLEFSGIGPVKHLNLAPGKRLNLITGDNGLGKTFLLDVVWWALTQRWAEHTIVPLEESGTPPFIKFSVAANVEQPPVEAAFDARTNRWKIPKLSAVSGLVLYARVDGSFAIWDPANPTLSAHNQNAPFACFTRDGVWKGEDKIEGLLRDWVRWQTRAGEFPAFDTFQRVLQRIKPPDLGELSIGRPQRVPGWSMEIPTLVHPYGTVPIVYESAGIRRVLTLVYLIVWAWEEHRIQAKVAGRKEERQLVILLDEAEAHLHPKWQRVLLPALLGLGQDLHQELSIQYFVATHSPLVLASAEPVWDNERDKLFHVGMNSKGRVRFESIPFEIRGTADSWLQSPAFDGLHPGSQAAERAIAKAKALLLLKSPSVPDIKAAGFELAEHVAADDPIWLRWMVFSAKHGVEP